MKILNKKYQEHLNLNYKENYKETYNENYKENYKEHYKERMIQILSPSRDAVC